jgi:hypothetical protein
MKPETPKIIVITDPIEVANSLAELGISSDILKEAILIGESARDACTPNDPPNTPGFEAWAKTVRGLRELLILRGWTPSEERQLSTIVNPEQTLAIAVETGDEATGTERTPKTKYPRGAATIAAVEQNQIVFAFMEEDAKAENTAGIETWMLVRKRTAEGVRAELSLPAEIGDDGRVEKWTIRIILEFINLTPSPNPEKSSKSDDIKIDITRKPA